MANRYLVGNNARNWNDTSSWSDASNGTPGSSVPTSSDAVILDAYSGTGTITITTTAASCASFDASAIDEALTISSNTVVFNCYGSLTEPVSLLTWTLTGTAYMYQKGTGTITTNGKASHSWNRWYIDGSGITVTNGDDFNFGGAVDIYLINGAWNTNGKTITTTGFLNTDTGTKTLTLGNSTFNIGRINVQVLTGFTFNYNTSTINVTTTSPITGITTFYNLTLTGAAAITAAISLSANITVSNVFTITGSNATNKRLLVASNTIGTARTITAASVVASYCDFRDITMANAVDLSAITGGSGNRGNNAGITFTPAQTRYYSKNSGTVTDITKWFNATNGGGGNVTMLLPQDYLVFDESSFDATSTLQFIAGNTYIIKTFSAKGTSAKVITVKSTTNAVHTLTLLSGQPDVQSDWLNLQYSVAVANKFFAGNGSVNGGNNTNWVFANKSGGMFNLL